MGYMTPSVSWDCVLRSAKDTLKTCNSVGDTVRMGWMCTIRASDVQRTQGYQQRQLVAFVVPF